MELNKSQKLLSDIAVFNKYARYRPDLGRRETWSEITDRFLAHMLKKYCGEDIEKQFKETKTLPKDNNMAVSIMEYGQLIYDKKVVPSMRMMQFAGPALEKNESRGYNCYYHELSNVTALYETMFLLLGGTGVGYSVQRHHVEQLPPVRKPIAEKKFVISDDIEGWSDAVKALIKAYLGVTKYKPRFDFSSIRDKGELLITSGGKAPGAGPLRVCLAKIEALLEGIEEGKQLKPIEVHDIQCHIADAVLAGGIRRAALISLFSIDDEEMMTCKAGNWWESNPQRGRANNSVVIDRNTITEEQFTKVLKATEASSSGEPGIFVTNDVNLGTNPCQPEWATVMTPNGISTIGEVNIGDKIWSGSNWTTIVNKWSTGIKQVNEYDTPSGRFVGTSNHRVVSEGEKVEVGTASRIDVAIGDVAEPINISPIDVMDGLVIGDGSVHKASNNLVFLYVGEKDQDYFKVDWLKPLFKRHRPGLKETAWEIETTVTSGELPKTYEREIPERFLKGGKSKMISFLLGLFSANGTVTANRVQYKCSSRKLANQVQDMLSYLGMRSSLVINKPKTTSFDNGNYLCKESYDIILYNSSEEFMNVVGFLQDYKNEKSVRSTTPRYPHSEIRSTTEIGEFEVFDLTVDDPTHTYWTGGLLVSNCGEISLNSNQFCNLSSVNGGTVKDQADFNKRVRAAAFFGTLQAGFTDFHYLKSRTKRATEKEYLLGVSITGIANTGMGDIDLTEAAHFAKLINRLTAREIGIKPAARVTTVKPEGTTSTVLGVSSGIHAWHSKYYIRNIQCKIGDDLYNFFKENHPQLITHMTQNPGSAVIGCPIKAPDSAILREDETALEFLERVKRFNIEWVREGHRSGANHNNVSCTVNVREDEWDEVIEWMWDNIDYYGGISLLPYDNGTYENAPFMECSKEEYEEAMSNMEGVDLTQIKEDHDNTDLAGELACSADGCVLV